MRVAFVIGTRPEAVKVAPVILAMRKVPAFEVRVIATAQHREMLDQVLDVFGIVPDVDLNIMQPDQTLAGLTSRLLSQLDVVLEKEGPQVVVAQGDTTTVMVTALACFYRRIPFCHIEAGLRSNDLQNPFPEELNRIVASRLATLHFAPTEIARQNLLREHVSQEKILVTGNTVIDALLAATAKDISLAEYGLDSKRRLILVTAHRRENFGAPMREIFSAMREIVDMHPDVEILYPVHPNPNVAAPANEILSGHPRIRLIAPMPYGKFCAAMKKSYLVLTDSGGVQEEAPALGKPVLVLRDVTERPEAVDAGVTKLVGTKKSRITDEVTALLTNGRAYEAMARGVSPYGDGHAAERITKALLTLTV
jgi:UDP-N-acetylglucosamine 2-epimerase (non-hydrolysing)